MLTQTPNASFTTLMLIYKLYEVGGRVGLSKFNF